MPPKQKVNKAEELA